MARREVGQDVQDEIKNEIVFLASFVEILVFWS